MKIGAIVPTRNLRPVLLERNREYRERQIIPIDVTEIVDYAQKRFPYDLTERYRYGLEKLADKCDLIFFMEDDDYYPENYIAAMMEYYEKAGSPEVFGVGETFFYHPELRYAWYKYHPEEGPAAFQMCIRSDAIKKIDWSIVNDLFIDAGLWKQLEGKTVQFKDPNAIGIKHGRGACGAGGHNRWFYEARMKKIGSDLSADEWVIHDPDGTWLRDTIGTEDSDWYFHFGENMGMI